ncbi:unnamed protein product [Timema podura]|uniref:Uncharacterized protein n=1 Tax=Timema podura TaxID=61482 RepID=A0ABN7NMF2_TIMPD|nr:unnamed protein product [Timema podura]
MFVVDLKTRYQLTKRVFLIKSCVYSSFGAVTLNIDFTIRGGPFRSFGKDAGRTLVRKICVVREFAICRLSWETAWKRRGEHVFFLSRTPETPTKTAALHVREGEIEVRIWSRVLMWGRTNFCWREEGWVFSGLVRVDVLMRGSGGRGCFRGYPSPISVVLKGQSPNSKYNSRRRRTQTSVMMLSLYTLHHLINSYVSSSRYYIGPHCGALKQRLYVAPKFLPGRRTLPI